MRLVAEVVYPDDNVLALVFISELFFGVFSLTKMLIPTSDHSLAEKGRSDLIQTVTTPLAFFALVVLVIEALLGTLAAFETGFGGILTIIGMLVVIIGLIAIVAYFAYHRPEALFGLRHKEEIEPSLLTAPLQEQVQALTEENQKLKAELASLDSIRLQVLGLLGAQSANTSGIVRHLGFDDDPAGRDKTMSVIGKLVEERIIEPDGMRVAGYYRLRKTSE